MLRQVAQGVLVHVSDFIQSNAVVVQGRAGVLLVDPGITSGEMADLAHDLRELGQPVVAGFSTHPDWDHVLWHAEFNDAPRYGTARCAAAMRDLLASEDWQAQVAEGLPPEYADEIPMDRLGLISGLPAGAELLSWDGPKVRIIEHQAHAPGHAALAIEEHGVLVAGDMLSDILMPFLDLAAEEPIADYLAALHLFESVTMTLMSSFRVTAPSATRGNCTHESNRIAPTCRPCETVVIPTTRGSVPRPRWTGCPMCIKGRSSGSSTRSSAGRLDSRPGASLSPSPPNATG